RGGSMRYARLRFFALVVAGIFWVAPIGLLAQKPAPKSGAKAPKRGEQAAPKAEAPALQPRRDAHVIMISIDGLVPDYYTAPGRLGLRVPNLVKMKLGSAYSERGQRISS